HDFVSVNCIFFFQAEDGIRDLTVTGVQTCALPIFGTEGPTMAALARRLEARGTPPCIFEYSARPKLASELGGESYLKAAMSASRSEERRVGKECRSGWSAERGKKKAGKWKGSQGRK